MDHESLIQDDMTSLRVINTFKPLIYSNKQLTGSSFVANVVSPMA